MAKKVPVKNQKTINPEIVIKTYKLEQKVSRLEVGKKIKQLKSEKVTKFEIIDTINSVKKVYTKSLSSQFYEIKSYKI